MSRKENGKNKSIIKLATLALAIGLVGSGTSYAYFYAKAEASGNLKITSGNMDVKFENKDSTKASPIDISNIDYKNEFKSSNFYIKNTGTLKEKGKIQFKLDKNIDKNLLKYFVYELQFSNNKRKSKVYSGSLDNLMSTTGEFEDEKSINIAMNDGKDLPLYPNEKTEGILKVKLREDAPKECYGIAMDYSMNIITTQINNKSK